MLLQCLNQSSHILDICATLEDLLQAGQLHAVFSDHPAFYKLLSNIFALDPDISP